jgi:hypothetical protein
MVRRQTRAPQFDMLTAHSELEKNAEIGLNQSIDKMKAIFAKTQRCWTVVCSI